MNQRRGMWAIALLALIVAAVSALTLWTIVHQNQRAKIGEEILYDDFGFRVRSVRTASEVGPNDARVHAGAGESFAIVRFEVENHARRVEYDMTNHRAVLESADGAVFMVDDDATRALASEAHAVPMPAKIRAGDYTSNDLVFRVPDSAKGLQLRVKWTSEPVDGLDQAVFGDRTIALQR